MYHLLVLAQDKAYEILKAIKLLSESEDRWGDLSTIPSRLVQNTCCKRAYLRGVFMAAGSITNPEKAYHLEIAVLSESCCFEIQHIVACVEIDAQIVYTNKKKLLYNFFII